MSVETRSNFYVFLEYPSSKKKKTTTKTKHLRSVIIMYIHIYIDTQIYTYLPMSLLLTLYMHIKIDMNICTKIDMNICTEMHNFIFQVSISYIETEKKLVV